MSEAPAIAFDHISLFLRPHFWSTSRALLSDVTFAVQMGQSCALLGANGAGKTTLLRVLLGLYRASGGNGWLDGERLGTPKSRRRLGFLPERPSLPLDCTPKEFVTFAARQSGLSSVVATRHAELALERLGITDAQQRRMRTFSKGMLQRVGLAQAVVHKPQVLVLDEPLSGLDPPARREVRVLIQQERARGAAILFSTHILSDVISTCDRAAVLVQGRLAHFAAPYALLQRAQAAEGSGAQVEVVAQDLALAQAEHLASIHAAALVTEYEQELRFLAPSVAAANQLLGALCHSGATILSVEQDTRSFERLLRAPLDPKELA